MIPIHLAEIYGMVGDFDNFIINYDPEMNEDLTPDFQLVRNVGYGILHNYEFAKKMYENKEKLELNYPILNHICCRFILSGEFNDYLIKNHPPHHLTYPEILNDEIFEKLFKKYKKELKQQLAVICIIKNDMKKYIELNPKPDSVIYTFAIDYNKPECVKQQINQKEKFSNKNASYLSDESGIPNTTNPIKNESINYLTHFNEKSGLSLQKIYSVNYEDIEDFLGVHREEMGELGIRIFNNYKLYKIFDEDVKSHKYNVKIKEEEIYTNIFQVFEIYRNLEKYENKLCKLAISKLIIMHIDIPKNIIQKYKPLDFTIENTWQYKILVNKYPELKNELLKGKEKFEKIMKKNLF